MVKDVSGMNVDKNGSKDHHSRNQRTVDSTNSEHIYIVNKHTWDKMLKKYDIQKKDCEDVLGRTISVESRIEVSAVNNNFLKSKNCEEDKIASLKNKSHSTPVLCMNNGDSRSIDFQNSLVNSCASSGETTEKCVPSRQNDPLVHKNPRPLSSAAEKNRKSTPSRRNVYSSFDSNLPPSRTKSAGENSIHDPETPAKYARSFARQNSDTSPNHKKSLIQKGHRPDHNINKSESSFTAEYYNMIKRHNTTPKVTPSRRRSVDNHSASHISSGSAFYTHVIAGQTQLNSTKIPPEYPHAKIRPQQHATVFCETQCTSRYFRLWDKITLALANFVIICIIFILVEEFPNTLLLGGPTNSKTCEICNASARAL